MGLHLVPGLVGLGQLLLLALARFAGMLDGLLHPRHLGTEFVIVTLHLVEGLDQLHVLLAVLLHGRFHGTLGGDHRLEVGFLLGDGARLLFVLALHLVVAQGQQLGLDAPLLFTQFLELLRGARLAVQLL